jgi:hypothetical protein
VKTLAKRLLGRALPQVYRALSSPLRYDYSIGIMTGNAPWALRHDPHREGPVLTSRHVHDVPAALVADPFMYEHDGRWYLFFEILNLLSRRGEIGVAVSEDGARTWTYQHVVLAEPWHLSYPHVFGWQGTHYMIPESGERRAVCLYKASRFPDRWELVTTLLEGSRYVDSSIFRHGAGWWMFTLSGDDSAVPALRLFFADDLTGPWHEHPSSPIATGQIDSVRPAGRVIEVDGAPMRFAQDSYPDYGKRVFGFRVTKLSRTAYEERRLDSGPILDAGEQPWNKDGMHHIDAHRRADGSWIACVDGFRYTSR